MKNAVELTAGLAHFYCTEGYSYLTPLARATKTAATDGIEYLAKNAGAFWLIDAIVSHQKEARKDPRLQEIQFWTLKTDISKKTAVLTCERDEGDVAITQKIEYTDFPLEEIKIWIEPGYAGEPIYVMMLPSER
jgi:hypothetical protein